VQQAQKGTAKTRRYKKKKNARSARLRPRQECAQIVRGCVRARRRVRSDMMPFDIIVARKQVRVRAQARGAVNA